MASGRQGTVVLICLLALPVAPSPAADSGGRADVTAPQVTVSGRIRSDLEPDGASNPHRVSPSSRLATQVIDQEEIRALRPRDVFDLLDRAVGVHTMSQGRKVPFTVRVRGDTQFAFLIDGVYVPQLSAGRMLQSLPVDAIQQIEIVRDATALSLAPLVNFVSPSGAPNDGFIVIRTRRPSAPEIGGRAAVSSFETSAGNLWAGTAGASGYAGVHVSGSDTAGRPGEHMAQSAAAVLATAGFASDVVSADFTFFRDRTEQQIQAADAAQSTLWPQRWSLAPITTTLSSGRLTARWTPEQVSMLTLARSHVSATLLQGSVLVPSPNVLLNEETIDTIDARHSLRRGATRLAGGLQWLHWNTPTGQMFFEGIPREERLVGGFVQAEQALLEGRLVIDATVRRDEQHVVRGVDRYEPLPVPGTLQVITDRRLPPSDFGAAGVALRMAPGWTLTGRLYHARQGAVPGIQSDPGVVLQPEVQFKREVGVSYRAADGWSLTFTGFDARIDNAKVPVRYVTSRGITTAVFGERDVHRSGFELQWDGHLHSVLGATEWRFGWSHLTGVEALVDQGRGAPHNVWNGLLRQTHGRWDAAVGFSRVGAYPSNFQSIDGGTRIIGDYGRLDASVGYSWPAELGRVRVSAFARNLTDARYQTHLGFRDPGLVIGSELLVER